jgi:hypothetical protein
VAGSTSLAKLLCLGISARTTGSACGLDVHPVGEAALIGPAGHRAFDQRPAGNWEATGKISETYGPGTGVHHRTLPERRWRFVTSCHHSGCRTLFLRTTPTGIERAVIHAHNGYFTATFGPTPQPCEGVPGRPGSYIAHFRLRWSKGGELLARERGHYGGHCTQGWTRAHWTATQAPATDGSSEASPQVL